jgi:hypothetical protein
MSYKKLPRLSSAKFQFEHSAYAQRVFLLENVEEPPFMGAVPGWEIVGHGKIDIPGGTDGVVVMLEKITPAGEEHMLDGGDMPEGTRIWQHCPSFVIDHYNVVKPEEKR